MYHHRNRRRDARGHRRSAKRSRLARSDDSGTRVHLLLREISRRTNGQVGFPPGHPDMHSFLRCPYRSPRQHLREPVPDGEGGWRGVHGSPRRSEDRALARRAGRRCDRERAAVRGVPPVVAGSSSLSTRSRSSWSPRPRDFEPLPDRGRAASRVGLGACRSHRVAVGRRARAGCGGGKRRKRRRSARPPARYRALKGRADVRTQPS